METIDKLRAVIKSCETPEQLAVARRYMQRAIDLTDACLYVAELHRLMRAQRRLIEVETALTLSRELMRSPFYVCSRPR